MNLKQALEWAEIWEKVPSEKPNGDEKALVVLARAVRNYEAYIHEEGERNNTCTYNVLSKVCGYCQCKRKPSNISK